MGNKGAKSASAPRLNVELFHVKRDGAAYLELFHVKPADAESDAQRFDANLQGRAAQRRVRQSSHAPFQGATSIWATRLKLSDGT